MADTPESAKNPFGIDLLWVAKRDYKPFNTLIEHDHGDGVYHYIFVVSGESEIRIGGETFNYIPGQMYLTAPGVRHAFSSAADAPLLSIELKFRIPDERLDAQMRKLPLCIDCRTNGLGDLITSIYREHSKELPLYQNISAAKAYELFCLLQRLALIPPKTSLQKEFLDIIQRYVRKNLSREITLSDLATQVSLEKIYFSKKFKALTGLSPMEYVRQERIEKAKELIVFSDMNITQISQALGFQSLQHLSNTFMKVAGCSPRQYKQTHAVK